MRLLLDTHAFIWWDSEPTKLSPEALELSQNQDNVLVLSVASIWEIQIKLQLGKLKLKLPLRELIANQRQTNKIEILPVTLEHVLALEHLPDYHKDPFDRLLISQANVEDIVLLSSDPLIAKYDVNLRW
jgi:PIN domain nuclease of toxin-antitoxin system